MPQPRKYASIMRRIKRQRMDLEREIARRIRDVLRESSDKLVTQLVRLSGTGGELSLLDAQRFRFAAERVMPELQRELYRVIGEAMREAGILAGTAEYEAFREIYKGELPVRLATELERMLLPASGLAPVIQTMKVGSFRGSMILSQKIWNLTMGRGAALDTLNYIVTRGVERGLSAVKLSKAIEAYLGPGREAPLWAGERVTKRLYVDKTTAKALGMRKPPVALRNVVSGAPRGLLTPKGTVSYNALRLARTEIQRSYRAMHVVRGMQLQRTGMSYIRGIRWNLSTSHNDRMPDGDICVLQDTMIQTKFGPKRIIEIEPGDMVLTHEDRMRRVTQTYRRCPDRYYLSKVETAGHELAATPNHPILTGSGWRPIGEVEVGDIVVIASLDGPQEYSRVLRTEWHAYAQPEYLFNLEVEEDQSYVANGIIVHNCDEWETQDIDGLGSGVYKPENVPMDHPNGMCYTTDELLSAKELGEKVDRYLLFHGEQGAIRNIGAIASDPLAGIPPERLYGFWLGNTAKGSAAGRGFFGEECADLQFRNKILSDKAPILEMRRRGDRLLLEVGRLAA